MSVPGAWLASQMPKENLHDFNDVEWVQRLLKEPTLREVPFQSRTITRNSTLHSLFNRTLATNDTLRACQAFHIPYEGGNDETECLLVASLGTGLDGHPGLAHGGTIGIIFDEGLSLAALTGLRNAFLTASTTISYKAALPTPGVFLCRSRITKVDGRKVWVSGTLEQGWPSSERKIFATAECLYIEAKKKQSNA